MSKKDTNNIFVKSIKRTFRKKTKEDIWDEDLQNLTENGDPVDKKNYDSDQLIESKWLQTEEVSDSDQGPDNVFGETGVNISKDIQPSPACWNGARPKTSIKSNLTKTRTEEQTKKRRISLRISEENGEPNEDGSNEHRVQEAYTDNDKTSDYGTMQKEDISSDDEGSENINRSIHFSRSEPNLYSDENLDEDIRDLRPLSNYYFTVKKSKNFQITPGGGPANFTKTTVKTQPSESEQKSNVPSYRTRHVGVLRSVRQTNPKIETELLRGGRKYLYRAGYYNLVIFKGSGFGCGFAAKMLFEKAVSASQNDTNPYCLKTAEELNHIGPDEKAIALVLDANGATGSDMMRLDGWYEGLKERMPTGACTNGNLTIIMTLQDFPTQQKRKHQILQKYSEYIVDAAEKQYRPDSQTKERLVEALLWQKNFRVYPLTGGSIIQQSKDGKMSFIDKKIADGIVPLLGSVRYIGKLAEFLRSDMPDGLNSLLSPIPEMVQRIRESYKEGGTLFLTLQAVHAHGGQLGVGRINQMRKLNEQTEKFWYSTDNIHEKFKKKSKKTPKLFDSVALQHLYRFAEENGHLMNLGVNLQKYACRLDGEFLAENNDVYRFCDGRVYYSFLLVYCEVYPEALDDCEDNFFFNFVKSRRNTFEEEKDVFLMVDDRTLNVRTVAVMERFKKEMMLRHVARCMNHPIMRSTMFFQHFLKYLGSTRHLLWKVLRQQDSDPKEPYSCLYHGLDKENDTFKCVPRNNTEVIIRHDIWKKKRKKQKWKAWIKAQESETLVRAAEISNCKTFELLVTSGAVIPIAALKKAMDVGAEDVVEFIKRNEHFSPEEWCEAGQHAANLIKNGQLSQVQLLSVIFVILRTDVNVGAGDKPPLIHYAVQTKNVKLLKILFEGDIGKTPVDINHVFEDETPLAVATRLGSYDIVKILLENHAILRQNEVLIASVLGHVEVLEILIDENPEYIYREDSEGLTPLFHAVLHGHTDIVRALLTKHDSNYQQVWQPQGTFSHEQTSSSFRQKRNREGQTAIHVAAEKGHATITSLLLSHGFNPRIKDFNNETSLSLACNGRHIQTIRVILSTWNPQEYKQEERVVMRAVQNGDTELLDIMIEYEYDVNFVNREYGAPLLVAIQYGMHDMVSFLLSKGADPEIPQKGHRPVHVAAAKGDTKSLIILKEFGANIFAKTDGKYDIIHIATEHEQARFVEEVLQMPESSSLINTKNVDGETALHVASKTGCSSLTSLLLQFEFSSQIQSRSGYLPVTLAERGQQKAIACKDKNKWNSYADCVKILQQH